MAKNNIKQASKKAQLNSKIDNMIANAGTSKGAFTFNMNILEEIVAEFIENVKEDINRIEDFLVTGSIQELSIRVNNLNELEVLGLEHIIYQSAGVNGAKEKNYNTPFSYSTLKPPLSVFKDWVKQRQLITKNNSKFFADKAFDDMDDEDKINQLAGALRETIFQKGYKGHGYWDKNVDRLKQELNTRIQQNLGDQIKFRIFNQYGDNIQHKK